VEKLVSTEKRPPLRLIPTSELARLAKSSFPRHSRQFGAQAFIDEEYHEAAGRSSRWIVRDVRLGGTPCRLHQPVAAPGLAALDTSIFLLSELGIGPFQT